jgi:hypothetical protein
MDAAHTPESQPDFEPPELEAHDLDDTDAISDSDLFSHDDN